MTYGQTLFLKLGGSLITDKGKAETALPGLILSLLTDFKRYLKKTLTKKSCSGTGLVLSDTMPRQSTTHALGSIAQQSGKVSGRFGKVPEN